MCWPVHNQKYSWIDEWLLYLMVSVGTNIICAFQFFQWWFSIDAVYQSIKLCDWRESVFFCINLDRFSECFNKLLTRCSNAICEFGGSPTQARRMFSIAHRWRNNEFTTGVPRGTSGALHKYDKIDKTDLNPTKSAPGSFRLIWNSILKRDETLNWRNLNM